MFQMLDAMLVMYIDLPARMNPGVSGLLHCGNHNHQYHYFLLYYLN